MPRAGRWLEEARSGSDDAMDVHGNLPRKGSRGRVVGHPITCTPLQNGNVLVASRLEQSEKKREDLDKPVKKV